MRRPGDRSWPVQAKRFKRVRMTTRSRPATMNARRAIATAAALAIAIAVGAPARACQYTHAPDPVGDATSIFIGGKMFAAATFVDLAIAENGTAARGPDGKPVPATAITYRVLKRLKGRSPDRFLLFGRLADTPQPASPIADLRHWVDDEGRVSPFANVRESQITGEMRMNSCDPSGLEAKVGRTYLIFREADGRALGPVVFHPGQRASEGFPVADIGTLADSHWGRQVVQLSYRRPPIYNAPSLPFETRGDDPARATVTFRDPVPAAAARAMMQRADARPYAVTIVRGATTGEYRLDTDLAWAGLVDDAAAWGTRPGIDPAVLRDLARQLVQANDSRDLYDALKREYANGLLALTEAGEARGPVAIQSIAFAGGEPVRRALAALPQVASVTPGFVVRGRAAGAFAEPPASPPGADVLDNGLLHSRLVALAGLDIPKAEFEGDWRLARVDDRPLPDDTIRLSFRDGALSGTFACLPLAGRYTLAGRTLTLAAPKPDFERCPKPRRESDWSANGFWQEPEFTLRPDGRDMLVIGSGAVWRFVRP